MKPRNAIPLCILLASTIGADQPEPIEISGYQHDGAIILDGLPQFQTGFFGATDLFEDGLLDLIFTNVAAQNVGDAAGILPSAVPGNWHISLHTGDALTDASTSQLQSEAGYAGYARESVVRSVAGWTVASGNVDNDAAITFTISTDGPETETDVGIGFAATGAGVLQMFAQLLSDLVVNNGITPEFAAGALDISLD